MNATTVAPWKKTRDLCILLDSFCLPFLNAIKPAPNDATVQANTVYVIIKTEIRPSGSKAVGVMVVAMTTATMMMTSSEPKRKSVSIKTLNMEKYIMDEQQRADVCKRKTSVTSVQHGTRSARLLTHGHQWTFHHSSMHLFPGETQPGGCSGQVK